MMNAQVDSSEFGQGPVIYSLYNAEINLDEETLLCSQMEANHRHKKNVRKVFLKLSEYKVGWVLDDNVTTCALCSKEFGIRLPNRRHHCRLCGNVVCRRCSMREVNVENSGIRACDFCTAHIDLAKIWTVEELCTYLSIAIDETRLSYAIKSIVIGDSIGDLRPSNLELGEPDNDFEIDSIGDKDHVSI